MSTTSRDVANVLYQCVTPQQAADQSALADTDGPGWGTWLFHGVPRNLLVGTEEPDGVSQQRVGGLPACLPEAIVVDHGRQYLSAHVLGVCARLGITVKPTDKPTVERFFRTLREGLLQHLPAYKGPDVHSRGKDVEGQAFFYLTELEQVIREWVGTAAAGEPQNRWAVWLARNGPDRFQLSRKAGWDAFVHAAPREPLPMLTRAELDDLGEVEREDFTEARLVRNANLPTVKTSQLAGAFDILDQVLASGRRDGDRLRGSVVIDAAPGLGRRRLPRGTPAVCTDGCCAARARSRPRGISGCRWCSCRWPLG